MTLSFGGGAGVLTIPGLTSDGLTPGGIDVAGNVQGATASITGALQAGRTTLVGDFDAGDPAAALVPSYLTLHGSVLVGDVPGNVADADDAFGVLQHQTLTANLFSHAAWFQRNGTLNGHQYTVAAVSIIDRTGGTADLQDWSVAAGKVAQMGQAGGLGLFGHAAPTAPRTLAQATITAITDANAKAAVQACANALADMGALTLT